LSLWWFFFFPIPKQKKKKKKKKKKNEGRLTAFLCLSPVFFALFSIFWCGFYFSLFIYFFVWLFQCRFSAVLTIKTQKIRDLLTC
jgi:hypothetical protein